MFVILTPGEWLDLEPAKRVQIARDHLKSLSKEDAAKVMCGSIIELTNACINFLDGLPAGEENVAAIENYLLKYYERNFVKTLDEITTYLSHDQH